METKYGVIIRDLLFLYASIMPRIQVIYSIRPALSKDVSWSMNSILRLYIIAKKTFSIIRILETLD